MLLIPTKAYAGNINGNEQSVIAVASGTFEYKGVTYKATSQHLAELRAKLMQDDVDLTPEQAQEAIASIYANVKTGIDEKYIVPISGSSNADNNTNKSDKNTQENDKSTNESQQNSTEKENAQTDKNSETSVNQQTQNSGTNQTTESNSVTGTDVSNQTTEKNQESKNTSNNQTIKNTNNNTQTVQPEEIKEVKTPEQLKWEKTQLPKLKKQKLNVIADNCIELTKVEETTSSDLEQSIVKDTSNHLFHIWIVPTIFFIGIGICAMCIIKYHLLAHTHES